MKVALICDRPWLMREMTTLRRLAVGLVGEGIQVVRIMPESMLEREGELEMTGKEIVYPSSPQRWLRNIRLKRLVELLRPLEPDAIHALDGSLGGVGLKLAGALGVPIVCSVWTLSGARQLARPSSTQAFAVAAPTQALQQQCARRLGHHAAAVRLIPPGVYTGTRTDLPAPLSDPQRMCSMLVVGNGRADIHYRQLFEAVVGLRERLQHAMVFLHGVGSDQHGLWQLAEKMKLLEQVSLVPDESAGYNLLVQADVVIQPQPLGVVRTLVLEAMAAARPVISAADPAQDFLTDGKTARVLNDPTEGDWSRCLAGLLDDPGAYVEIGRSACDYVRQHHTTGAYVQQMAELYRQVAAPQPLPFDDSAASKVKT